MRKAQSLTAYIVIGLILLIGFSILYAILWDQQQIKIDPILYPKEVQPLANYVTQCIEQEGADLVKLAASQGGFVEIPPFIKYETDAHLTLDDLGLAIIPYWTVPGEERIPPLEYIQKQMSVHLTNNTLQCLDSFNALSQEYAVEEKGPLITETIMGNENVVFKVAYPLVIRHKATNTQFDLQEFVGFVPVRFKQMYELGKQIMEFENDEAVIENTTIDLMSADPKVPLTSMTFDCAEQQWSLFEVKKHLQRSLAYNLGTMRIKNTNHEPFQMDESVYKDLQQSREEMLEELSAGVPWENLRSKPQYTPPDAWEYFHTYFDVGARPTPMKVIADYNPSYGMHINAQPNDNGILRTKLMKGASKYLRFLCINNYHFTYDVQFPMRIGIIDPVSNYGQGALFQFAFPVLIDDNSPSRQGLTEESFPVIEPVVEYCDSLGSQQVDLRAKGFFEEGLPASELRDVQMDFVCVNRQCNLGTTTSDSGTYRLKTHIPNCVNPLIRASKEGYVPSEKFLDSNFMSIELTKLKDMNLEVVRHIYRSFAADDPTVNPLQPAQPLGNNQEVSIFITHEKSDHNQFKSFPEDTEIQMIDDTAPYDINLILTEGETVIGGYLAENVSIPYSEISKGNTLTLHVFEYTPFPRTAEDEKDLMLYLGQESYKEELKPTVR